MQLGKRSSPRGNFKPSNVFQQIYQILNWNSVSKLNKQHSTDLAISNQLPHMLLAYENNFCLKPNAIKS